MNITLFVVAFGKKIRQQRDEEKKRDRWFNESEDKYCGDEDEGKYYKPRQSKNYTTVIYVCKISDLMLNLYKNSNFSSIFGYSVCAQNFNYKI